MSENTIDTNISPQSTVSHDGPVDNGDSQKASSDTKSLDDTYTVSDNPQSVTDSGRIAETAGSERSSDNPDHQDVHSSRLGNGEAERQQTRSNPLKRSHPEAYCCQIVTGKSSNWSSPSEVPDVREEFGSLHRSLWRR